MNAAAITMPARVSLGSAVLLCVLPFLQPYHRLPLTAFYTEWIAFALGLGVLVVLLDRRSWQDARLPWAALPLFLFAGLVLAHGIAGWSPYFGQALLAALYLVWAGLLVVAARALLQSCGEEAVQAVLAWGLVAGALLSAAIGIIQHFNFDTPFNPYIIRLHGAEIFGNLAQRNHFATQIALGLFAAIHLQGRGRLPPAATVVLVLPLLFVLGLSASRSAWLYLFAAFAAAAWLRLREPGAAPRRFFIWTGLLIVVYYLLQLAAGAGWFAPAQRESVTAVERLFSDASSVYDRLGLWRAAWTIALDHPLLGVGWGAFASHYFGLVSSPESMAPAGLFNNVHNLPLHLLAETGLAGALLLLLPAGAGLLLALRARPAPQHPGCCWRCGLVQRRNTGGCGRRWGHSYCTACSNTRCGTPISSASRHCCWGSVRGR